MSRNVSSSTRLLIEAEQRASAIVAEARKSMSPSFKKKFSCVLDKIQKLKQCKEEAERDIVRFKDAREVQFQKFKTEVCRINLLQFLNITLRLYRAQVMLICS